MAGAQKNFELLFKLTASLGGNFHSTFNAAVQAQKRLSDSVKNVNALQSKIDGYNKANAAIQQNQQKLQRLTAEHDRLQSELAQTAQKKRDLQRAMETAEAEGNIEEYKRLQKELSETSKEYSRLKEKYKANQNQLQQATAKIEEQQRSLEELAQELREAGLNTDDLERANERLKNSYERLQASQERLKNLNQQQEKIKQNISATKTQILGTVGAYTAVAAAIYAGPVQAAQKYEAALAKVNTIADTTQVPLEKISQEVMALSNKTGVAASALAEDVYNAISAGQQTGDAVNFVSYSTKLAKAGFAETSQTLDVLTTILNAYGMSADKVGNVSDMLIQIQNKGKVSVGELSSVMGKIIPTANAYNVSLEQLGATYAIMTSKGIAAAETTTYANSMLNELGKSGSTADKILRKVAGGGFSDLMANGSSLAEVLDVLQKEAQKSGKTIADMFGSAEAGKAAMSILSNGVDGFNESVEGMLNSVGATETAFGIMADTTENKMAKAKNSINNLQIVLGQNLLPIVGNVADKVAGVVTKVSEFAQANPQLVQTVLKVVGALAALKLGGLGLKLGFQEMSLGVNTAKIVLETLRSKFLILQAGSIGLIGRLKNLGKSLTTLGGIKNLLGGMGGIAGKILPIVAVVAAVITVVQLLRKNFDKVREAVGRIFGDKGLEIFDKIVAAVTAAGDAIKNVFSGGNMDAARQKIESIFGAKGTAVFDGFIRAAQTVGSAIGSLVGFITEHVVPVAEQVLGVIVSDVIPGIVGGIQQAAPVIMQIVQAIANFIAGIIPVIGGFIAGIMPVISEIITFVQTNVFPIVQQIFSFIVSTVLPAIVSGVQFLAATITAVLSAVLPVVQTVFTTIWNIIQPILQQIFTTVQAVLPSVLAIFQNVFNTIGGVVNGLATVLSGLIQFITGVFSGNWGQAWEGIKSVFSGAWDALTSIVKGVINNIIGIINGAIAGLNSIKIPDWVPVVGGKGVNIPQLPTFARGTARTPSTFIAGEKGPELITNAPGMTVYTAERTQKILETSNRAAAAVKAAPAAVQVGGYEGNPVAEVKTAPEVTRNPGRGGGTQNITVNNSPTIVVNGDKPDDLEQKLEANNQKLIREIREMQRQDEEDERRAVYE
ncbi:phage tail tape measure protein [Lawsonibacter sp. JLR.KK007]|uniref:phage tail tape measure protein n=1 Tax=Lawsonibacter sp. JLR.KK007 TaxID=3114293 RepID=UPI002FF08874